MAKRQINKLLDSELQHFNAGMHNDGNGLYLQVIPTGGRSWILRTVVQGKRVDLGLGGWPECTLEVARERAIRLRRIARTGDNPRKFRERLVSNTDTLTHTARLVFEDLSARWSNSKHKDQWIKSLEKYVFPSIGSVPVDEVGPRELANVLSEIWLSKPETARRVLQRIGVVLSWAQERKLRRASALDTVVQTKKLLPKVRRTSVPHKAMPYTRLPNFIKVLKGSDLDPSIKLALEFLILTVRSSSEVSEAKISHVNLKKRVWEIRNAKQNGEKYFKIPLSRRCIRLISEAKVYGSSGSDLLFPSSRNSKKIQRNSFLIALRQCKADCTVHGFRESFRQWTLDQSTAPRAVVEEAVGLNLAKNISNSTDCSESSDSFKKRQDLMEAWAWFLA